MSKYDFDYTIANEALELYKNNDPSSVMAYQSWRAIYHEIGSSIVAPSALGSSEAVRQGVNPGRKTNLVSRHCKLPVRENLD